MKLKLVLLSLSIAASFGYAQTTGQNVIYNQLKGSTTITGTQTYNFTTCTTTIPPGCIQNIGQTNHTVVITLTAVAGGTLNTQTQIYGSNDGTNWFLIGPTITTPATIAAATSITGIGYNSYPYLKTTVIISFNTATSATFSINYIGNSIANTNLIDAIATRQNLQTAVSPNLVNNGVDTQLIGPITGGGALAIYALMVDFDTNSSTLTLWCSVSGTTHSVDVLFWGNLGGSKIVRQYPIGDRAYFYCPPGYGITYSLAGASSVANLNMTYRQEIN